MPRILLIFCLLRVFVAAEDPIELLWPDLIGPVVEFEDPFEALTSDQLYQLGTVARLRGTQAGSDKPLTEANATELAESTAALEQAGINIDALLGQRAQITELRRQRASATRDDLGGKTIRMPGYVLPLDVQNGEVTEYLLVPWVGACIHTPPPPPNQIVYVKTRTTWDVGDQWEPVWVEGTLQIAPVQKDLYLVDGNSDISIAYTLTDAVTAAYPKDG